MLLESDTTQYYVAVKQVQTLEFITLQTVRQIVSNIGNVELVLSFVF